MRILIDGRVIQDRFPGIGRYTYNLTRALAAHAPEEEILLLFDPGVASPRLDLKALHEAPRLRLVPAVAPLFSLAEQWRLSAQIRSLSPDLVHLPYYIRPYWLPGLPVVCTSYDVIPIRCPDYYSRRERFVYRAATTLSLRTATLNIAISQATANDLRACFGTSRESIVVIPLAADRRFEPQNIATIEMIRTRYDLPSRFILYVGSNKPHKNLVRLIESRALLGSDALDTALVIAGHWDDRYPEAQRRASELGLEGIRFLGPISERDLPPLYAAATCFVFPSLYEGFGLPVLEAMACGTPVVCSCSSSLPEVAGEAAVSFDPLDTQALAKCLSRVLTDHTLRQSLGEAGIQQAGRFSWDATAASTMKIYRRAIST